MLIWNSRAELDSVHLQLPILCFYGCSLVTTQSFSSLIFLSLYYFSYRFNTNKWMEILAHSEFKYRNTNLECSRNTQIYRFINLGNESLDNLNSIIIIWVTWISFSWVFSENVSVASTIASIALNKFCQVSHTECQNAAFLNLFRWPAF